MLICMSEQESSIKQAVGAKPLVCVASDLYLNARSPSTLKPPLTTT